MTYLAEMPTLLTAMTRLKLSNGRFIKAVHSFILSTKSYKKVNRYLLKALDSCKLSIQSFNNDIESYNFAICHLINNQAGLIKHKAYLLIEEVPFKKEVGDLLCEEDIYPGTLRYRD